MRVAREPSARLPEGTVSFLLAEADGSSSGDAGRAASPSVTHFYEIYERCVEANGGVPFTGTRGPKGRSAAFGRASDAVTAALESRLALAAERPNDEPLRIKMAIHTGDVGSDGHGGYQGHPVAQAIRLLEAAQGGQILVSSATADVAGDRLPKDVSLIDLGTHWLKDLRRHQLVYQLSHPDLPSEFAPLGSLDTVPNNLPIQTTSFVGREDELGELGRVLSASRLLTLSGGGGCGKTRLAAEIAAMAAEQYPDGVWWVELANLDMGAAVPDAAMSAIGIEDAHGKSPTERLAVHLAESKALLVLDNCEHVLDGCAQMVEALSQGCANLTVLTTSREAIGIAGESVWRVPPLSLPRDSKKSSPESLTAFDSVRLFIDRAVSARPNFRVNNENAPVVAEICARLDGIPLAIELAAARVRMMTLDRILEAIDDRFRILTRGTENARERQGTLLASVQWSYDLLSDNEQALLLRLSVFAGGFELDAAEHVCSDDDLNSIEVLDLLGQLVDKSLVSFDDMDGGRYGLLQTIRQFAAGRLNEADAARAYHNRHLAFFLALAEELEPKLELSNSVSLLDRFEAERDNFHAALGWALDTGDVDSALKLSGSLATFWVLHGHYWEAQIWLKRALEAPGPVKAESRMRALWGLGHASFFGMDIESAFGLPLTAEALELARTLDDKRILTRSLAGIFGPELFFAPEAGKAHLAEAIAVAKQTGDDWGLASTILGRVLNVSFLEERHTDARPILQELLELAEKMENRRLLAVCEIGTGLADLRFGKLREARPHLEAALAIARDIGEPTIEMFSAMFLADLEIAEGRYDAVHRLVGESDGRLRASARGRLELLELRLASVLLAEGDVTNARVLGEKVLLRFQEMGMPNFVAPTDILLGQVCSEAGELGDARKYLEEALAIAGMLNVAWITQRALHYLGRVTRAEENLDRAEDLHHQAIAIQLDHGFLPDLMDSLDAIGGLAINGESWAEGLRLYSACTIAREGIGSVRSVMDERRFKSDLEAARIALGEEVFGAATAEGSLLSMEQAISYASRARGERRRPSSGWASLTPTETEVVRFVAQGLTNPDIAERLFITRSTVKTHLSHVFTKLGVSTRAELASEATRRGI